MKWISAAAATVAVFLAAWPTAARDFTYRNERFGTTATFPREAFPDQVAPPTNGDGLGWTSPDGAEIFIYARSNGGGETPRSVIADRSATDKVTYKKAGRGWAVVSGYRDGLIFYERYIFRGDLIHSVSIRYPEGLRSAYDRLVGRVTNTLRGGASS